MKSLLPLFPVFLPPKSKDLGHLEVGDPGLLEGRVIEAAFSLTFFLFLKPPYTPLPEQFSEMQTSSH